MSEVGAEANAMGAASYAAPSNSSTADATARQVWQCTPDVSDKPERPWVVVATVSSDPSLAPGTMMYGTTQKTAATKHMPHCVVTGSGRRGNGLMQDKPTWFIGTRVNFAYRRDLTVRRGELREIEYSIIQRLIKVALGIDAAPPVQAVLAASWRGRVVALQGDALRVLDAAFGLVVTDLAVSALQYDQVVVPLHPIEDGEEPHAEDVLTDDANLAALVGTSRAVLSTDQVAYVFHSEEIDVSNSNWVVPESLIEQVEARFRARFSLHLVR